MYLVVNNAETKNGSIYLVLTFKPNSINVNTYTRKELTQLYTSCKLNKEAINIRIDEDGDIAIKLGTTGRGVVPIITEYAGVSTFVPISAYYIWSVIANAVTDEAQLIVDGRNIGEITSIDFYSLTNTIVLNKVQYSPQGTRDKLVLKYKTGVPIEKLYSKMHKETCSIDYSKNIVTISLTKLIYHTYLKGIIKLISPPLLKVVNSILDEYQWVRQGYEEAYRVTSSGLIDASMLNNQEEVLKKVLENTNLEVTEENREYIEEGINSYIFYGEEALLNVKPENQYMFKCLSREYNMIKIYSNYLEER